MKKFLMILFAIIVAISGLTVFSACTKYVDYNITVNPLGESLVEYSFIDGVPVYTVYFEDEEVAKVRFTSGNSEAATANSSSPISFIVEIPKRYNTDNFRILVNGVSYQPDAVPYIDKEEFYFDLPAPEADVVLTIEGLNGTLKELEYILPVVEDCPLYLKNGNNYIQIKEESTALLEALPYIISFEESEGEKTATFTFEFGEQAEFYIADLNASQIYYSREGFGDTAPYHSELYTGAEGYTASDKEELISTGYAFMELTHGGYYWKVTQLVMNDILFSIFEE